MGLWAPPVRQPWHGHAVCWAAFMRRRIAFLEAAAVEVMAGDESSSGGAEGGYGSGGAFIGKGRE